MALIMMDIGGGNEPGNLYLNKLYFCMAYYLNGKLRFYSGKFKQNTYVKFYFITSRNKFS